MKILKSFVLPLALIALGSCTSTPSPQQIAPDVPVRSASDGAGYMTRAGLVIYRTQETQYPYEAYMGEDCLRQLASMNSWVRKVSESRCTAVGLQTYQMQQICAQAEREYAIGQQKDQACLAKREAYARQKLTLTAIREGMSADFARLGQTAGTMRFSATEPVAALEYNQIAAVGASTCFALKDERGALVPVRDSSHEDRYTFGLPYFTERGSLLAAQQNISALSQKMENLEQQIVTGERSLRRNAAYSDETCVAPKQRALPPRPQSLSAKELEFQVNGGCTELMMRRFSGSDVTNAFIRLSWDDRLINWRRWSDDRSRQNSCSKNLISQMDTAIAQIGCSMFFKDQVLPACIQSMYKQCRGIAESSCTSETQRWSRTVARIQQEPVRALETCQNSVRSLAENRREIERLRYALMRANTELQTLSAEKIVSERISLEEAQCR